MILADTSIWIDHFRRGQPLLGKRLTDGLILMHPFVLGELACGNLKDRATILRDLNSLPVATAAANSEVMLLVESRKLWARGLGWIDAHLLASALLSHCQLWTLDKQLHHAASDLKLT